MKIIITESQYEILNESLVDDMVFRDTIKSFESTVVDSKGRHYVFDDKESKTPKTFVANNNLKKGGKLTIGWGHTGKEAIVGNKILNSKAEELLSQDISKEESKAKQIFPKYNTYPLYVQRAITNSVYRGEAKSSYEWVKAINLGDWSLASKKYLEGWDIDFSQSKNPKYQGGVADRMVKNQEAFIKYAKEIKGNSSTSTVNSNNTLKVGAKIYPKKTSDSDYANVRTSAEVNTGFINNLITTVYYPNLIGVIEKTKKDDTGKVWYYVKLAGGLSWYYDYGWVRYDVVTN